MENAKILLSSDKRKHERFPLETIVRYQVINRQVAEGMVKARTFHDDGQVVNISAGGVALVTDLNLQPGDYLKVEVTLPGLTHATRALAQVIWVESQGASQHKSGLSFLMLLNEPEGNSVAKFLEMLKKN